MKDSHTLTVISNQTTSSLATTLFRTHFDMKIFYPAGDTTVRLYQGPNNEMYRLCLPEPVDSIIFDPGSWLLQTNTVSEGIPENDIHTLFRVFPNPVRDRVVISFKSKDKHKNALISICTVQGQLLLTQPIEQEQTELDMSNYRNGIYILTVSNNDKTEVTKLVKE